MEKAFRMDNTEDINQTTLDLMNDKMDKLKANELDLDDMIDSTKYKEIMRNVFYEYCF